MPYCRKCGATLDDEVQFCVKCGTPVEAPVVTYFRRPRRGWTIGRIFVALIGGILLIASVGMILGGVGINWAQRNLSDAEGFLVTGDAIIQVDSYAVIQEEIRIDVSPISRVYIPNLGDFVTLKFVVRSNDPSKEIFIGIAGESEARTYLRDVRYHEVEEFSWSPELTGDMPPVISYTIHEGPEPPAPPIIHSFWVKHVTGSGTQVLKWEPELGNYWIVVMNADGSLDIDLSLSIGAKIPILNIIKNVLFSGGLMTLIIGVALLYFGVYQRMRAKDTAHLLT